MFLNIENYDEAAVILRSYNYIPRPIQNSGAAVAMHDVYGVRDVATVCVRFLVWLYEKRATLADIQLTPGHEAAFDFRAAWQKDVQQLADMLSYEPVTKRYGYYANRKWYMKTDAIMQRLQHEGHAWINARKVREAVMLRKAGG